MSEADAPSRDVVAARVKAEIDRAIQRNIKGLEFLTAPRPAVGAMEKDVLYRRGTLNLYRYRPIADEASVAEIRSRIKHYTDVTLRSARR